MKSSTYQSKGGFRVNGKALREFRRDPDRFVVKQVDDDGGSGVWIGRKLTRKAADKIIEKVRDAPGRFILQEFEHLSVLENRIVDLRIHAHVDCERIIVSKTPWGGANWLTGNGKVNIGSGGFISPVVVVPDARQK